MALSWLQETSIPLFRPGEALDERESLFLHQWSEGASLFGLGEMTHGAREVFLWKNRLLRYLIELQDVRVIVFEAGFASTTGLNDYVLGFGKNPKAALARTGFWSMANKETLEFILWLRQINATRAQDKKVCIHGCDIQSMDDAKSALESLLNAAAAPVNIARRMRSLPDDKQLNQRVAGILAELDKPQPSIDVIETLQTQQSELTKSYRDVAYSIGLDVEKLGLKDKILHFWLSRTTRLLNQCLDHYSFEDSGVKRDAHMAENLLALREFYEEKRFAFVAANWHVAKTEIEMEGVIPYKTSGSILAKSLGNQYRVCATAFSEGSLLAMTGVLPSTEDFADVPTPPKGSVEHTLRDFVRGSNCEHLLLNCRLAKSGNYSTTWIHPTPMNIGEAGTRRDPNSVFVPQRPLDQFDALMFTNKVTPITVLPDYYEHQQQETE